VLLAMGLVSGCGGDGDGSDPLSSKEVVDKAQAGTVQVVGRIGDSAPSGTGIVIDANKGLVLTNAHVVNGVGALQARFADQQPST
jgi:S1-C subfamily serine protease